MMKPVIRIMPMVNSGSISGQILPIGAEATIFTTAGLDTILTYPDSHGVFKLMTLPERVYIIYIHPVNESYKDTVTSNINVVADQNTDFGVVELQTK